MSIKVTYHYSACVSIETKDLSILCDPWFTDGAFDGAWYHYPRYTSLDVLFNKKYDFIYISHLHPDHYDVEFLKKYLAGHNSTVLIADFKINYLHRIMLADGVGHRIVSKMKVGDTELLLVPNGEGVNDIDSALAVKTSKHSVANMNDNFFSHTQTDQIKDFCGRPDIGLLGYSAASAYPQRFYSDPNVLAEKKKVTIEKCLGRYRQMADGLNPKIRIPFAGQYILGGRNAPLTEFMAFVDPLDVKKIDSHALVLETNESINTSDLVPSRERQEPFDMSDILAEALRTRENLMPWERELKDVPISNMQIKRLLPAAFQNAKKKSKVVKDWTYCIKLADGWFVGNANHQADDPGQFVKTVEDIMPRTEISVDEKYLFGLLTSLYHWNNAFVGSHFDERRYPDEYDRDVENFINFYCV